MWPSEWPYSQYWCFIEQELGFVDVIRGATRQQNPHPVWMTGEHLPADGIKRLLDSDSETLARRDADFIPSVENEHVGRHRNPGERHGFIENVRQIEIAGRRASPPH